MAQISLDNSFLSDSNVVATMQAETVIVSVRTVRRIHVRSEGERISH